MAHNRKLAIWAIFLHFKDHKSYQGILGTLEVILIGSRTQPGPSMDPTLQGPYNGPNDFRKNSRLCTPFVHYTLCSPSKHLRKLFLVIVELYQDPGDHPGLSWTIMDPQRDPKMDPARQFLGDPW